MKTIRIEVVFLIVTLFVGIAANANPVYGFEGNGSSSPALYPTSYPRYVTFISQGTRDGWVLESTETSSSGGIANTIASLLYIGDNAQDKQYRSFVSFNTGGLKDNAVITKVRLKIRVQGFVGDNMFKLTKTHGNLLIDIGKPYFGTNAELATTDFQSAASKNGVGVLASAPVTGWYTVPLKSTAYPFINLTGTTQLRLRFQIDDNDDLAADYMRLFSGDSVNADQPQLIIEYHIP